MKLLWSPLSPYARKVMIVAHEHDLAASIECVRTPVSPPNPELMRSNPLNKIPTLLLDDGSALFDSTVICEYLDDRGQGPKLFPASTSRWPVLTRHALGAGLVDLLIAWRLESVKPVEQQSDVVLAACELKANRCLDVLEAQAAEHAGSFDISSIAVGCALLYLEFRFADRGLLESRPMLGTWMKEFRQRRSVQATDVPA